ncbi:type II toxin-antitoxin system RelE/ParE family toxin [Methylobacterium oryzisoli]|uniref:type II toxin-antitoxin system RelE/ParE family toxin n=1 Tax=Methylobacterium oryzisoli TaxID=3385502 RepID=UPI0038911B9E
MAADDVPHAARPQRRISAEFYRTESGNEPVREWLRSLPLADRQTIGKDIRKAEYGWPIGMPTCDALGDGLWEIRTSLNHRIARVFFCLAEGRMILLHGIIKKSRVAPQVDLETARKRRDNLQVRLRTSTAASKRS